MQTWQHTSQIIFIYFLIHLIGFCVCTATTQAADSPITIVQNYLSSDSLVIAFDVNVEKIFTTQTRTFLQRGFTIQIDYKIELWKSRRFWFDKLKAQEHIQYELNYDILNSNYHCIFNWSDKDKIDVKKSAQLEQAIVWVTQVEPIAILPRKQVDLEGKYYYTITADISTLTAGDIRDLQQWLKGDSDKTDESSISRATFRVVTAFLSAKNHRKFTMESKNFYITASRERQ